MKIKAVLLFALIIFSCSKNVNYTPEIIKETSASQREDIKQLSYNINKLAEHIRENSNDMSMAVQAISTAVSARGDKYERRNGKGPSAWIGYLLAFVTPMIFVIASISAFFIII